MEESNTKTDLKWSREDLAWAAGFLDGEGYFGMHYTHGRPTDKRLYGQPMIEAAQVDRRVLDRLQKTLQMGKVRGPYQKKKASYSESYLFQLWGFESTQTAIALLWPWLSPVKREQAATVLKEYLEFSSRPKLPMGPKPQIAQCHPERRHEALGLCKPCYTKSYYLARKNGNSQSA